MVAVLCEFTFLAPYHLNGWIHTLFLSNWSSIKYLSESHRSFQSSIMTDDILHDIIAHTDILRNWTQTLSVIHDGDFFRCLETSQLRLPSDSRYRFDSLQFKGLAQLNSIRHLILGPSFWTGCQMVSSHHRSASPHRQGTWHFACSKHRVSRNDNTTHFSPGHMSMKRIKQQTLKRKKTLGSTHAGVEGMYSHKTRLWRKPILCTVRIPTLGAPG